VSDSTSVKDEIAELPGAHDAAGERMVTVRSVGLGLLAVLFICGLTPYNDFVINNTFIVGNFLPAGLLLFVLLFIFVINGPLTRWAPRHALNRGELAVATGMALVSCCLPSSGLMRYLPALLSYVTYRGNLQARYGQLLDQMHLPNWLFPTLSGSDAFARGRDPVITGFVHRIPTDPDTFLAHWHAVPWMAWVTPAIAWGVFLMALYATIGFMAVIVRRQWVENERLAFPLVSVYSSLIEPPEPGRAFNTLFSRPSFWVACGAVFAVYAVNGLHVYLPTYVPNIPLNYNMNDVFVNEPWNRLDWYIKGSAVFFSVVGIAYFVQTSVGFSLWFFVLAYQVVNIILAQHQSQMTGEMQSDQLLGALLAFSGMALWVGRSQWALVMRHMFGRRRPLDPQDIYLPYSLAGWGMLATMTVMVVWLVFAGCTIIASLAMVGMLIMMMMGLARIVAETGLPFAQFTMLQPNRPWVALADMNSAVRTSTRGFFLTSLMGTTLAGDLRESAGVFFTHSLRLIGRNHSDNGGESLAGDTKKRFGVFAAFALALLFGYLVSGASTLYCEYRYESTLDEFPVTPINNYAVSCATDKVLDPTLKYDAPNSGTRETHSHVGHLLFGAAMTAALSILRLRFAAWPFHPVGFLLVYSYPMQCIWFSLLIGWLAKVFTLRLGGLQGFNAARPVFVGLIVGEAAASSFWLVVSLLMNVLGHPYHPIRLLPG
jgi:hypothetical protein